LLFQTSHDETKDFGIKMLNNANFGKAKAPASTGAIFKIQNIEK
jgi:hypothetical protein